MTPSARFAILSITFLTASCASISRPPENLKITLPAQRIFQLGYSLVPPNEEGWEISQRDRLLLSLGKLGTPRNEVIYLYAVVFKLKTFQSDEEFVGLVKEQHAMDTDSRRFKVLKHEVTSYVGKGTPCAHSHQLLEDHEALTEAGQRTYMLRETSSLTCAHPKNRDREWSLGVNVTYAHRYYTGHADPQFLEKAASVLQSVEFSDLPAYK
jgi:hypothetical protein